MKKYELVLDDKNKYDKAMENIKRARDLKEGECLFYQDQVEEI